MTTSSLSDSFASSMFAPASVDKFGNPISKLVTEVTAATSTLPPSSQNFKTTSFFIDSSGRSSFSLPLQLAFTSQEALNTFLASKCLNPSPTEGDGTDDIQQDNKDSPNEEEVSSSVGFEVQSYSVDETKPVVVEGVRILQTWVTDLNVCFETEVTLRALNHGANNRSSDGESLSNDLGDESKHNEDYDDPFQESLLFNVLTNLEITPVLTTKKNDKTKDTKADDDVPDLLALELGAIPDHMQKESTARKNQENRLSSMQLNVTLTHAFTISVKSVQSGGASLGQTLVSLTIRHANSHTEQVTISNIALHPGHSRYETTKSVKTPGGHYSITNMTKSVQWGFMPRTELQLPLTLSPHDAYSTVLMVNGGEEMNSRSFVSPVSVTGTVGGGEGIDTQQRVVVASDAHWSTELVAVEPADAFRITMSCPGRKPGSEVCLGEPLTLSLNIFNLSLEPRNLMLIMAKDNHQSQKKKKNGDITSTNKDPKEQAVNSAIVAEMDGYTFGVWGISPEDDGTVRLVRDHHLLAVDAALLLGEVVGQHSVNADIRFVPLAEGRLKVPNWRLYDKASGNWYSCAHNLSIVAQAK